MKTCTKCKVEKPLEEYYNKKGTPDGKTTICKVCRKADQQARRDASPDHIREINRKSYDNNRERRRQDKRENYQGNRERLKAVQREYHKNNPWVARQHSQKRRATKANANGSHSAQDQRERLAAHGHKCIYCGFTEDLHLDHIKPLSQGGSNWPSNLAPACGSCNLSKHAKWGQDLIAWGTKRFGQDRVKSWPFLQK